MNENNNELFFKDCFTEQDGKINAEFNKITVKCLNSINNNFSLDCDGNLSVNSIITKQKPNDDISSTISIDLIYPIGTYYETSDESFNPNTTWNGTWILDSKGRVTVSKDETQNEFSTLGKVGGEMKHQLTLEEMPSHRHAINLSASTNTGTKKLIANDWTWHEENQNNNGMINPSGNDEPHNNLQPYIVVKRWHRIG